MIVLGQKTPLLGPVSHSYEPSRGVVYQPSYEGEINAMYALANTLRRRRVPYEFLSEGVSAKVIIRQNTPDNFSGNERPAGAWSLVGSETTRSLKEHPNYQSLTKTERTAILNYLNESPVTDPTDTTLTGNALAFYYMLYNGQDTYAYTSYTLRHTYTCSPSFGSQLGGGSPYNLYSFATLISEGEASSVVYDDPISDIIKAEVLALEDPSAIFDLPAALVDKYAYAWLKKPSTITTEADGLVSVSVEYVLDIWPIAVYGTEL